ncbi:ettA, partial [Symbiodinium sp. CCMP2456]
PTNHLDAESINWLERYLADYNGTIVAVTHDRYFLDNVASWILEIEYGRAYPFEGNYSSWLEQKAKRLEMDEKKKSARQKTLTKELEWIRSSPKARQAKSKARISSYEKMASEEFEERPEELEIQIPPGPRLGDSVIEAVNLSKSFGDKVLFENVNFRLPAGGITVWEEISDGMDLIEMGKKQINSRAYVAKFNFQKADQQKKVGVLSGGERNRVHLAKLLREAVATFVGCAIVVSHDRWFLDRLATHILAFEGDGYVHWCEGNFYTYENQRRERLGIDADQPHRFRYKKLEQS